MRSARRFAGDVLQKYVNNKIQLAIVGQFTIVESKGLHSFIIESNRGRSVFFFEDTKMAIQKLFATEKT